MTESSATPREVEAAPWSDELEELHEETSRTHFLDQWTREAILAQLDNLPADATVLDLGCSSGYLLEDLRVARGGASLAGLDFIFSGLLLARENVPTATVIQGDGCLLPFKDASFDAIVSANMLEHVRDDQSALKEIARVLRPGGCAVIVVPAAPSTYDYYDRFLCHERRYARHELANKARSSGFAVTRDHYLGFLVYPAFWLVKKRNRWRYSGLEGDALRARVARDIGATSDSKVGQWTRRRERWLVRHRMSPPFGIRELVTIARPSEVVR